MKIYTGHTDTYGPAEGTDILLTIWSTGHIEVALREGNQQRWVTWGPPVELREEEAS